MVIVNNKELTATYAMIFTHVKTISLNRWHKGLQMSHLLNSLFYKLWRERQPHHGTGSWTDHMQLGEPTFCRRVLVIIIFRPKQKTVS